VPLLATPGPQKDVHNKKAREQARAISYTRKTAISRQENST
jgi:hypothetical protein